MSAEAGIVQPSASCSITVRTRLPQRPGAFGQVASAIGETGTILGAIDLVRVEHGTKLRDITVACIDSAHGERVVEAVRSVPDVTVENVSDRTFLTHLGGKIEVNGSVPVKTRDDLSMAYTPGVARVCTAIAADPELAWSLTVKGNMVAVVSDGTAVLGLGDIGPAAPMPVMEGKALLFKEFADVDAFPLCIDTTDIDEIVAFVTAAAPTFGGINLEDISAPRCFEIERRLRLALDIPVEINNVLAFPGVFRGALDVRASTINEEMKLAAARAIASVVTDDEIDPENIIPSPFNRDVAPAVAREVAAAAVASGVARRSHHEGEN